MGDVFMTGKTRELTPAGNVFQIPGAKDLYHLAIFLIELFGEDHDLLFLLFHVVLMAFDAVLIQRLGHIGESARSIGKLAA
jgi:hypothetical protein